MSKRVPGHSLLSEGAPFDDDGRRTTWNSVSGRGRGRCSCGAQSDVLPSAYKRKQWHRDHKAEVAA